MSVIVAHPYQKTQRLAGLGTVFDDAGAVISGATGAAAGVFRGSLLPGSVSLPSVSTGGLVKFIVFAVPAVWLFGRFMHGARGNRG